MSEIHERLHRQFMLGRYPLYTPLVTQLFATWLNLFSLQTLLKSRSLLSQVEVSLSIRSHVESYPCPMNINYLWNFGMLVSTMIVIQIITGILLATYYCPDINVAYNSVMFMIREVNNGVFIQTIHSTGASMVFALTAIHIVRGANLAPYTPLTWLTGIIMLCLLIVISFMGYVLPWGQMSYWGATVITNLLSPIPYLVNWICGGYNISNPTIKRFFVIHFVLPFICCGLIVLHLFYLHSLGSNNPLQLSTANKIPFHPYIVSLDMKGLNGLL